MDIQGILKHDISFRYMLLDRLRTDCEYYLGNGNRFRGNLWANSEKEHIEYMKALWNSFPEDGKPEWLSFEKILEYEKQMVPEKISLDTRIQEAAGKASSAAPVNSPDMGPRLG